MIPLKDNIERQSFPIVNTLLIILNVIVFVYEMGLGGVAGLNSFIVEYGVIPTRFLSSTDLSMNRIFPLFSSMFMHANLLHIGGNMLFLFIFGDNVEDSMGHFRYLFFYILVGLLSGMAHIFANPSSTIPSLGASGAIAGVLGAYFLIYPRAKVATLIFLLFFFQAIEVPAWIFLGLWFLLQIVNGTTSIGGSPAGGVAWWAHIGGFASGMLLVLFFKRRRKEDFLKYF